LFPAKGPGKFKKGKKAKKTKKTKAVNSELWLDLE
jgi:hypothetical protein